MGRGRATGNPAVVSQLGIGKEVDGDGDPHLVERRSEFRRSEDDGRTLVGPPRAGLLAPMVTAPRRDSSCGSR